MYIRKIKRTNSKTGSVHHEYRLVESVRTSDGKIKQVLLFNLGRHFNVAQQQWPLLAGRIKTLIHGQLELFVEDETIESSARRIAELVMSKQGHAKPNSQKSSAIEASFETVDVNNIHFHANRTVGCEHLAHQTLLQLGFDKKLLTLGLSQKQINAAFIQIIGRLTFPASELATHEWFTQRSGLNELLDINEEVSLDQLYRISDRLLHHKEALETFLYQRQRDLFNLKETIVLYDLTNTYFEGRCQNNDKAAFGRSKEKRSDCRLVTLGLVLDGDGFPKRSDIFSGNVSEPKTLKIVLEKLCDSALKPTIIFDAGITTEANLNFVKEHGYDYLVVSRKKYNTVPSGQAVIANWVIPTNFQKPWQIKIIKKARHCEEKAR